MKATKNTICHGCGGTGGDDDNGGCLHCGGSGREWEVVEGATLPASDPRIAYTVGGYAYYLPLEKQP